MTDIGISSPAPFARERAAETPAKAQPKARSAPRDAKFRLAGRGRLGAEAVAFTFDGQRIVGRRGDTVASALLANGIHLMGRSFKYHRPRGVVTAGSEEPNALIGVRHGPGRYEPNTRATMQEIYSGLSVVSQNRFPTLDFDVGAVNDALSPFLGAGFYYKTFMWPKGFWDKVYEPAIRAAAGLGKAPQENDPDRYTARYAHVDVLIVGGGPAGLAAALTAGASGARVMLVDEHAEVGGSLLSAPDIAIDGASAWAWVDAARAQLDAMDNVRVLTRATAIAYDHQNMVGIAERLTDHLGDGAPDGMPRERLWRVRAREVILAQGAVEKPLVFDGNDRPGVMLAGAALTYLQRFGVAVGKQVVVATSHDSAWETAFALAAAGVGVSAIADVREAVADNLTEKAAELGIPVRLGTVPTATAGRRRVYAVHLNPINGGALPDGDWWPCDTVLMSGGWTPTVSLFSHTKGKLVWDSARGAFLPGATLERCRTAGAGTGTWGIGTALREGSQAAADAVAACGFSGSAPAYSVNEPERSAGQIVGALPTDRSAKKAFVDFQNDVTAKDVRQAVQEGMVSIEHVKRYTTTGMATDQGKLSNINALFIAAEALGKTPPEVGLTTFRPPYTPTTFGTFANHHRGAGFDPVRKTPIDSWAEEQGAVFEPVALWRRARYFPRAGENMDAAVLRECRTTREAAGVFDASTLGKIEVVGPDAAEFLNRVYTNPLKALAVGKCRYALLLGEDGFIRDDGIIARFAEDRFHVTTTTGGAPRVLNMMEDYLQTEWPDLKVWLTSTTEQWATVAIQGPLARRALAPLVEGDISDAAFAHMSVMTVPVAGVPARLFRASFTGECGFEVNVPAGEGRRVWEAIWAAAQPHGACVYGTETMHVLRAEKGFIIVGQDTDGTVTPHDAGLSWAVSKKKPDFIGKRGLARPDLVASGRKELVGLLTEDPNCRLDEGAQIVADPSEPTPMTMLGHVTSSYRSAALGRTFAMALLIDGRAKMGQTAFIPMPDGVLEAEIVPPMFYDASGERLKGEDA